MELQGLFCHDCPSSLLAVLHAHVALSSIGYALQL